MRVAREQRRSGHAGHDGKVTLHIHLYPKSWTGKLRGTTEILYGIAGCCGLAGSGHPTPPPSNVMNSRRFS